MICHEESQQSVVSKQHAEFLNETRTIKVVVGRGQEVPTESTKPRQVMRLVHRVADCDYLMETLELYEKDQQANRESSQINDEAERDDHDCAQNKPSRPILPARVEILEHKKVEIVTVVSARLRAAWPRRQRLHIIVVVITAERFF